ncbi:alpha-galactosidase [Sphingobacterium sp. LRF_L2]|uniref:alpha-galactosidase n=1 Tax=Sphingobacterium sp. LRF_L2 TaxID=3369421 RepID=UPI003F62EE16
MQIRQSSPLIKIETDHTILCLEISESGQLINSYYGQKLINESEYRKINSLDKFVPGSDDLFNQRLAYVSSGSLNLMEPALSVTHWDGNNTTVLSYVSHNIKKYDENVSLTRIELKDDRYAFFVTLFYKCYAAEDVIEQWAEIRNEEKSAILLNKYASANITIQGNQFLLKSHYSGWGKEMRVDEHVLNHGLYTLDSKLGTRTNLLLSSSFMLSIDEEATETNGNVLAGSLAWSGNFRIDFERFDEYYLRITSGINNYASVYTLEQGEIFTCPSFIYTLSWRGKGQASRNLHAWAQKYQVAQGLSSRVTILNNWEATYFDFDEEKLASLIQNAKELGVDLFLLDDGWFGNKYPRNAANAALGDWIPNTEKLPNGLAALIEKANCEDIQFGLWLEPEMVSPKSVLYENHPDWVLKEPLLPEYYMRNQLVLDLTNPEVQEFIYQTVHGLLTTHPRIAFIKWDCNSLIYNVHSSFLANQNHLYIAYTKGFYHVLENLRKSHPEIPMMLCAGGGSRVDYGALKYFTEFWPSDNTNPYDRIFIQWEYSYYFPAITIDNHVTAMGTQPIKFKIDVAFMGKIGFDIRVNELNENDLLFAQQAVKTYGKIKNLIWYGSLYRLQDPYTHKIASLAYVNPVKDTALVLNYYMPTLFATTIAKPIKMQGLLPDAAYQVEELNTYPNTVSLFESGRIYSGDFLMKIGFNPQVDANRTSVVLLFKKV